MGCLPPWLAIGAKGTMVVALALGTVAAAGHHLFYQYLDGQQASGVPYRLVASLSVNGQQISLATGAVFAALAKAAYGLAASTAQEQTAWRTIRRPGRATPLAAVDGLLQATSNAVVLAHPSLWARGALSMALAALSWLLAVAFVLPASTLTVQSRAHPSRARLHVPRIDFLSMNFADVDGVVSTAPDYRYDGPQYGVQTAVAGALTQANILPIAPPHPNASWSLDFVGPALSCGPVDADLRAKLPGHIDLYQQRRDCATAFGYLCWTSTTPGQDPLPFAGNSCALNSPSVGLGPAAELGAAPLSLYVAALPSYDSPALTVYHTINQTSRVANMTAVGCTLQNASYTAQFRYVDGQQTVSVQRGHAVYNNVSYLAGVAGAILLNASYGNGTVIPDQFNTSLVANFAYQAVMNMFNTFLLGSIGQELAGNLLVDTRMATTALINTKELSFLYDNIVDRNSLATPLAGLPSSSWNGLSVVRRGTYSQSMVEVLEEMFTNATVSLMSSELLNPNYSSPYAPGPVSVTLTPYYNTYVYARAILLASYGVAAAFALLSVGCGLWSALAHQATYSTKFSTILRMAPRLELSAPLLPRDMGGEDPTPDDVNETEVRFPRANKAYEALSDGRSEESTFQAAKHVAGRVTKGQP